jgi:hypothetical protein
MKIVSKIIFAVVALLIFAGCGKDNFDEPTSVLKGTVVLMEKP